MDADTPAEQRLQELSILHLEKAIAAINDDKPATAQHHIHHAENFRHQWDVLRAEHSLTRL